MKPLYLVLPCYNESKSLPNLFSRVVRSAQKRGLTPREFTLVMVENGSRDNSLEVMHSLTKYDGGDFLKIVPVKVNRGYGYGIYQGLKATGNGIIAWTHADEQCDPEDVFRAWENLIHTDEKVLIKGKRHGRSTQERFISLGFESIASILFMKPLNEINAQPKVFDSSLLENLTNPPHDFAFDLYVLIKALENGFKIRSIDVQFPPRIHGESNWASTFRSKTRTILRMLMYMIRYRLKRA